MPLSPGVQLGPYEILAVISAGELGEVYRARDTRQGRTVAIKILQTHFSSDPVQEQRFAREARTIASLNHPYISVLYDFGSEGGINYFVTDYLEGETLAKRLEKGALPLEQVLKYGRQIADALDNAHRSGVVHRDLKPSNIMLTATGVKLLDFGLAKSAGLASPSTSVSEHGTIVGTLPYMSPEQIEGKEVDGRSDIFSLGAVLYEMLTGQRAFPGNSLPSIASAILDKEPPPISTTKPTTPPALDHAIRTSLAKDPEDRWQTARDLVLELNWVAEAGSQAGVPGPSIPQGQELPKRILGSAFGLWSGMRQRLGFGYLRGHELGPGFGMITERLSDLDLSQALPDGPPHSDYVDSAASAFASDSGPTPQLRNANVWAAALETHLVRAHVQPPGVVLTTFGFVRTGRGVRLAVIRYMRPWAAFAAPQQENIEIMGWSFPVIVRPWLPTGHKGPSHLDGNCWVKFFDEEHKERLGVLTARHVVKPKMSKERDRVRLDVSRTASSGELHYRSEKMDAAIVGVEHQSWGGKVRIPHSTVVGYKPVRIITGQGTVDADVVEHEGFIQATIPAEPGKEPLNGVYLFLNRFGEPGDSGCLVLDLEFAAQVGARPYLIYLGVVNLRAGLHGYGLLIEQANKVWGLECYMNENP